MTLILLLIPSTLAVETGKMTSCFLPKGITTGLELYAKGGDVRIRTLKVRKLRSIWE